MITSEWTRRAWLVTTGSMSAAALVGRRAFAAPSVQPPPSKDAGAVRARRAAHASRLDPGPVQALAQRAVEAATAAGASYADARFTRTVWHHYYVTALGSGLGMEFELIGCGVRVLVDGAWGFASSAVWLGGSQAGEQVVDLARDAVGQAKTIATGISKRARVELAPTPVVTGTWTTPHQVDPFGISLEERYDTMAYWTMCAERVGMAIEDPGSHVDLVRQERVVATSEGSHFIQTCYETGGVITVGRSGQSPAFNNQTASFPIRGIEMAGQGWERFLNAEIPEQIVAMSKQKPDPQSPASIGRYTLVCDGATMGAFLGETVGVATQLDRALGYEANNGGSSFLTDPLNMLGSFSVASPLVTVTANRSAPTQLATVKWDDEGVAPRETTLIKNGVLTDFQTTREQATWLAPYHAKIGRSAVSNGYAASQDAQFLPMQMTPNLALAPSPTATKLEDLIASVKNGLLMERGTMSQVDFQARNGLLTGSMRRIVNGKLGRSFGGGETGVLVNTLQFLKQIKAVGDASTADTYSGSIYDVYAFTWEHHGDKGNPAQRTSYSSQGVAALIEDQAVINVRTKA